MLSDWKHDFDAQCRPPPGGSWRTKHRDSVEAYLRATGQAAVIAAGPRADQRQFSPRVPR